MNVKSDASIEDSENPPITEAQAQKGWVRLPDGTRIVPVKMDAPTYQWFLSQGQDVSAQIETALRDYAAQNQQRTQTQPA